jgi:hypothetical protein
MEYLMHPQPTADLARVTTPSSSPRRTGNTAAPHLLALGLAMVLVLPACKSKKTSTGPAEITSRAGLVAPTLAVILEFAGSQISSSGTPAPSAIFDDFTFTGPSTIRTASWQGAYCVATNNSPGPTPTATAFRVSFYADVSGRPQLATPLAQATYPIAQTAQTLEQSIPNLTCNDGFGRQGTGVTFGTYRYQVTLSTPFVAAANTKYWFSVQAITPTYTTLWGWRDGLRDNQTSLRYFNNAFNSTSPYDRAFSLTP